HRGRQRAPAAPGAAHRGGGLLAAVAIVWIRRFAGAARAAADAVPARAGHVRSALAIRIAALAVRGTPDVDRAAGERGDALATAEVRGAAARASRALAVVRARHALAAGTLVVGRAVAVRVRRIARDRGALEAAVGRAREAGRGERGNAGARELAIEAVAPSRARAMTAARDVVLAGDLDALAAQALGVV